MPHPAVELVGNTCKKIIKHAPRKHQKLIDEATALLNNLPTVLRPATVDEPPHVPTRPRGGLPASASASAMPASTSAASLRSLQSESGASETTATEADEDPANPFPTAPPHGEHATASAYVFTSFGPASQMALCYASVDAIMSVLRQAADVTDKQPVVEAAIDCAQRLIAFKFMQGSVQALGTDEPAAGASGDAAAGAPATPPPPRAPPSPHALAMEIFCKCVWPAGQAGGLLHPPCCATYLIAAAAEMLLAHPSYLYLLGITRLHAAATYMQCLCTCLQARGVQRPR